MALLVFYVGRSFNLGTLLFVDGWQMKKHKFQEGDIVRCIDTENCFGLLKRNGRYKVKKCLPFIDGYGDRVVLKDVESYWYPERFVIWQKAEKSSKKVKNTEKSAKKGKR